MPARRAGSGRVQRADAESKVDFLSLRQIRERCQGSAGKRQKNGTAQCLFQAKPPVHDWV
jgi:hypothetical protein